MQRNIYISRIVSGEYIIPSKKSKQTNGPGHMALTKKKRNPTSTVPFAAANVFYETANPHEYKPTEILPQKDTSH